MKPQVIIPEFLSGGGEMGQRMREQDWSLTPLGPVDSWPQSLRTCIRIMLDSRQPIWIGWGKELTKLYNDPYREIAGGKHPRAFGQPASVVWKDIWREIGPLLQRVMEGDEGTYAESQLLIMERNGYAEETYYTFSYTPIPGDDGATAGMICFNTDDTERIISERQLKTLTRLAKELADCQAYGEVMERTLVTMTANAHDFPFVKWLAPGEWSGARKIQVIDGLEKRLGPLPKGVWEIAAEKAIVLPVYMPGSKELYGYLLVGINPYRLPDEKYWDFFTLVADQVANKLAAIHVLEVERKKAEALAEIDRAKTIFFSNISHEFRTPLTLLLGPIEDVLNDPGSMAADKYRMDIAYRNVLRMQKLVNTLLEFSRIEAGRTEAKYNLVDVGELTRDLASSFRSAVEKAGMELRVDCGVVTDAVYVDVEMWEQIVLNLLSNAFKYSTAGTISVDVRQVGGDVVLTVSDTGIGIPEDQVGKIFDRFHRIERTQGRSLEGTGIGLAMVKELVRLHQGTITVKSEVGVGSSFSIAVPVGKDHLPAARVVVSSEKIVLRHAEMFVTEAMKWLPGEPLAGAIEGAGVDVGTGMGAKTGTDMGTGMDGIEFEKRYKVLLADDNADMREYVQRLLSQQFGVITAANGEEAFEQVIRFEPDLVLSDVMMPVLDGFGLLKKIRAHAGVRHTPVIFLSARAGEEAKVDGMAAGADDYLVKPFSAKELVARVDGNIRIARSRVTAERQLRQLADSLEEEVKRQTRELRELNISLQQSNEDLQQFAHVASHDLKEPVRKIRIYSQRLREEYGDLLPERARVFLERIQQATLRMVSMIDGVLTYSTLNGSEQPIGRIDLDEVLGAIGSDLEVMIAEKKAVIKKSALPEIEGAGVLIYQLFYNLLHNSLKFGRAGELPVISVSARIVVEAGAGSGREMTDLGVDGSPEMAEADGGREMAEMGADGGKGDAAAGGDREMAEIRIADNGIGFGQEHAGKIFDTFARLHSKDQFDGTGLGLALCKKIVERHQGSIVATGVRGEGSVFLIRLPLKQKQKSI